MFQEERIKRVRKTTKWAVTANESLRLILIDSEEYSKMARHGGISSDLLDNDRKDANEYIEISKISSVSIPLLHLTDQFFVVLPGFGQHCIIRSDKARMGLPSQHYLHIAREPVEDGSDDKNARSQPARRRIWTCCLHHSVPGEYLISVDLYCRFCRCHHREPVLVRQSKQA